MNVQTCNKNPTLKFVLIPHINSSDLHSDSASLQTAPSFPKPYQRSRFCFCFFVFLFYFLSTGPAASAGCRINTPIKPTT